MQVKREFDDTSKHAEKVMIKNPVPEEILDVKKQGDQVLYLVKWAQQDVSKANWLSSNEGLDLNDLIREFKYSKKSKPKRKQAIKIFSRVENGSNPYEQTIWQGHFLYGDKPKSVTGLKVLQSSRGKCILMEVQWKARSDGTILENSLIDTRVIAEHDPDFLLKYYQSRVQLKYVRSLGQPKKHFKKI